MEFELLVIKICQIDILLQAEMQYRMLQSLGGSWATGDDNMAEKEGTVKEKFSGNKRKKIELE